MYVPFQETASTKDLVEETQNVLHKRKNFQQNVSKQYPYRLVREYDDNVISQGILTEDAAMQRLDMYRDHVSKSFPVVPLPPIPMDTIMKSTPLLFHCVIAVASHFVGDSCQLETSLLLQEIAFSSVLSEIFIAGSRSLELLQCLVLLMYWYNQPLTFDACQIQLLCDTSLSVGSDIGVAGPQMAGISRGIAFPETVNPQPGALGVGNEKECSQAWLAALSMQFQPLIANNKKVGRTFDWTFYEEEKLDSLSREDFVVPRPPGYLPIWFLAGATRIFSDLDKERATEPLGRNVIHKFETHIEYLYEKAISSMSPSVRIYYLALKSALYQDVLYCKYSDKVGRSPFTNLSLNVHANDLDEVEVTSFRKLYTGANIGLKIFLNEFNDGDVVCAISPLLSTIVMLTSILLNCRALTLTNKCFAQIPATPQDSLQTVTSIITRFNTLALKYPIDNTALSYSLTLKLLLAHYDSFMRYLVNECNISFNDPSIEEGLLFEATQQLKLKLKPDPEVEPEQPDSTKTKSSAVLIQEGPDNSASQVAPRESEDSLPIDTSTFDDIFINLDWMDNPFC